MSLDLPSSEARPSSPMVLKPNGSGGRSSAAVKPARTRTCITAELAVKMRRRGTPGSGWATSTGCPPSFPPAISVEMAASFVSKSASRPAAASLRPNASPAAFVQL
ncbi:hypothetical protein D3C86_1712430 [compost metagenome]